MVWITVIALALFASSAEALSIFGQNKEKNKNAQDLSQKCKPRAADEILQEFNLGDVDDIKYLTEGELEGLSKCDRSVLDRIKRIKASKEAEQLKNEQAQAARETLEKVRAIPDLEGDYLSVGDFREFNFQDHRASAGSGGDGEAPADPSDLTTKDWMSVFINLKLTKARIFKDGLGDDSIPGGHLLLPPNTNLGEYFDKCDECITYRHAVEATKDFSMRAVLSDRQALAKVAGPWVEGSGQYKAGSSQKKLKKGDQLTHRSPHMWRAWGP